MLEKTWMATLCTTHLYKKIYLPRLVKTGFFLVAANLFMMLRETERIASEGLALDHSFHKGFQTKVVTLPPARLHTFARTWFSSDIDL